MLMSKKNITVHEVKSNLKQIKIPVGGQLSKKGTVIRDCDSEKEIDYSISEIVESINKAGFKSKYSCSGLKKDHPFKDVKHDGAYISFLHRDNSVNVLDIIKNAALRLNMTVEQCRINQRPALVIRIDKDKIGSSLSDRMKTANELGRRICGGHSRQPYGACTRDLEAVLTRNGGLFYDSDEKIEAVWKKFCEMLLKSSCQYAS